VTIHIVRLGSPRAAGEGPRVGTVRRPPRGVPKAQYAAQNWYDVWYPVLSPSAALVRLGQQAATAQDWALFKKKYRAEMAVPEARHALELLATLSHHTDLAVGCYCEHEGSCHRSVLRELLTEAGAQVVPAP
jgi:uncharacterized protein YeaO (DUF488 family)